MKDGELFDSQESHLSSSEWISGWAKEEETIKKEEFKAFTFLDNE